MTQQALDSIRDETLAVMRRHTDSGDRVALLDFPSHENAGDSLIYVGQQRYFEDLDVQVDYLSDIAGHNDRLLSKRLGDSTIFLHGGGNFGDRWPIHQNFRERIVARYPHNKIVALPQSIDYSCPETLTATAAVYAQHPDLTLMVREHRSHEIARAAFPDNRVEYCPDMAFGARISSSPGGSDVDVVKLLREDCERIDHGSIDLGYSSVRYDWGLRGRDRSKAQVVTLPSRIAYNFPYTSRFLYPQLVRSYNRLVLLNLTAAQRILNTAPVVLTDRLHAAALAAMMGKRVVAMDNANKKVSGIYDAYLHRFDNVHFASTTDEAAELVRQAVSDSRR